MLVPSSKPRVQCYVTPELRNALDKIAALNNESLSETATAALEKFADPNVLEVSLDSETIERLKILARDNYRSLEDQVRMLVIEGLKEQERNMS